MSPAYKRQYADDTGLRKQGGRVASDGLTGSEYADVPYMGASDSDLLGGQFEVERQPGGGWRHRDENGHWTSSVFYPREAETAALDRAFERFMSEKFGKPNPRGIAELGTHRSKRKAADLRRALERVNTCEWCGKAMPAGSRSDARTCSERCKKARQRSTTSKAGRADRVRPGYALHVEGSVEPKQPTLSPLTKALIAAVDEVLTVPMPYGYPDEREWREGQYHVLKRLRREEHSMGRESVAMFKRRARSYINAQRRLAAANPAPKEATE